MKFCVLIVTYNPKRDLLQRVCRAIMDQSLPAEQWRLVIVDNASSPPLQASEFAALPRPVTLMAEPRPGQTFGRYTGMKAVGDEAVVLADDDTVLEPGYLLKADRFMAAHPEVGAFSGIVEPEFETEPAAWMRSHSGLLAVRNLGDQTVVSNWRNDNGVPREYPWCAPSAGMVIRAECVRRYLAEMSAARSYSLGRIGTTWLGGCEECEIMVRGVLEGGFQVAYAPELRLTHCIPTRRVQESYLRRLAYETGISWAEFCVRHRFMTRISRWTVPLRIARSYFRERAWQRSGYLSWLTEAGRFVGRSRPTDAPKPRL